MNGVFIKSDQVDLEKLVIQVAEGKADKSKIARFLREKKAK
jgi:hypothetical protein